MRRRPNLPQGGIKGFGIRSVKRILERGGLPIPNGKRIAVIADGAREISWVGAPGGEMVCETKTTLPN